MRCGVVLTSRSNCLYTARCEDTEEVGLGYIRMNFVVLEGYSCIIVVERLCLL